MSDAVILCINPNAAIDKTVIVSPFRLNAIHRPQHVMSAPGGKGCNVARALNRLGMTPVVTGWIGGFAGQFIEEGLRREGIRTDFVDVDFESRTCLSIVDQEDHTVTEIYETGDPVPTGGVEALKDHLRSTIPHYALVTFSGSVPPGVPADFAAQVVEMAHAAGVPVLLDSSGESLGLGAERKPMLIKPNQSEFVELIGRKPGSLDELAQEVAEAADRFHSLVVVSLGAQGVIAANREETLHVSPPQVTIQSAVGSGDCLLAGIACGLIRSLTFADAVRYGVAAGTANALTFGAGVFSREDFEIVLAGVTTRTIAGP